jgi:hypothetical protein
MYHTLILKILATHLIISFCLTSAARPDEPDEQLLLTGKPFVYKLKSEEPKGRGYRLEARDNIEANASLPTSKESVICQDSYIFQSLTKSQYKIAHGTG